MREILQSSVDLPKYVYPIPQLAYRSTSLQDSTAGLFKVIVVVAIAVLILSC
jgi:hypothetical protein